MNWRHDPFRDEDAVFTKKDHKKCTNVVKWVRSHLSELKATGRKFDAAYTVDAIRGREWEAARRMRVDADCSVHDAILKREVEMYRGLTAEAENNHGVAKAACEDGEASVAAGVSECPATSQRCGELSIFDRVKRAWDDVLDDMADNPLPSRRFDEAAPVALRLAILTWLLYDTEAEDQRPKVTTFQDWPWQGSYSYIAFSEAGDVFQWKPEDRPKPTLDDALCRREARERILFGRNGSGGLDHPVPGLKVLRNAWRWGLVENRLDQQLGETPADPLEKLPPAAEKANEQYQKACDALNKDKPTDREAFDWWQGQAKERGRIIVTFATWQRYLRVWRKATGMQKNTPRGGRAADSRSVSLQVET